jgi:hypothetical protein
MAEEQEKSESTGGSIKNIIIGLVSTITLGVGGWFTTKLTGGDEKETPAAVAPIINIQNNQTQTAGGGGKTIIINKGGDGKAAPAPKPKKKEGDEFKEEAPKW